MKLFDIHGDIWTDVAIQRAKGAKHVVRNSHLERFRAGNMAGGVFIAWVDPPHDAEPVKRFWDIVKAASAELFENADLLSVVRNRAEYEEAVSKDKIAVVMGIEGLSAIEDDIELLYPLYQMGFRHCSLTWNEQNALATGVRGDSSRGLTDRGVATIRIIEKLGMILDTSHLNEKSFWDVVNTAEGPIIASHSNVRAICDVPRNLTDKQIMAIGASGGLVGLNAFNEFVHKDQSLRTVDTLIDHLEHVARLIGADKIALGFDFFEYISAESTDAFIAEPYKGTIGLEDITKGPALVEKLRERGFSETEIEGIAYRNFIELLDRLAK